MDVKFVPNSLQSLPRPSPHDRTLWLHPTVSTQRVNDVFDNRLTIKTTDNLYEGSSNLYYTTLRANNDFDIHLKTKTTSPKLKRILRNYRLKEQRN